MTLTVGGGTQTVNVQIKNSGEDPQLTPVKLTIDIPADLGLTISSKPGGCDGSGTHLECTVTGPLAAGATKNLPVGIAPPAQSSIPAGQSKQGSGQVIITDGGSDTKSFNGTLKAAAAAPTTQAAPPTVTEVAGTITDAQTGKGISGATVVLKDGAGHETQLTSGNGGSFRFVGSDAKPIAPGAMTIEVGATGYETSNPKSVTGTAGKGTTGIKIGLVVLADTASPAPLPSANDGAFAEGQPSGGVVPQNTATNNASNDSGGGVSWILIALGVLLVGFGIVAIVLLLRRRGDDDDDDPDAEPAPRRGAPGGVRPGYGAPQADPTMVGAMGPAATMINRGGSNDATAIVRPGQVFDDVPPDPYGAPPPGPRGYPSAGGYDDRAGFASGGYNGGGANGYGAAQAPGRPVPGPAVDPYAPDYNGGGGGYADSTQRYEPGTGAGANGFGAGNNGYNNNPATGGNNYGDGQGGYGGNNGYDGPAAGGGYGGAGQRDRGGYEGPPTTIGGFGGGDRGGYDGPQAGGGYEGPQAGGYNAGGDRGGYGPNGAGGGYDDRGGYGPGGGGGYDGPQAGGGYSPGGDRGGYGPNGAGGGYDDRGGYGPQAGGGYDGPQGGGYDGPQAGGGYSPGGERGGYGPNGAGGGGYDDQPYAGRGGYGPNGAGGGGERGGYEPAAGYDRDGYERVPEPPRAGNGYGPNNAPGGEYDQRGGYGPNNNNGGGNRRSLDWLDD